MPTYTGTNASAPKLEGQALRRYTSQNIKENIFQSIIALPNRGVTEQFSEDTQASEIRIIRELEPDGEARDLGGDVNGGWYDGNKSATPKSVEYPVRILHVYDRNLDMPTVMDDMVEVGVAEVMTRNLAGKVARNVNASTLATQIGAVVNAKIDGKTTNEVIVSTTIKDALIDASTKLDDGDTENGIDIYPEDMRQIFIRPTAYGELMKTGEVIIGGSNYAQDMLAKGIISPDTYVDNGTGYCGEIMGISVYKMSKPIWTLAEKWMGIEAGKLDKVKSVMVSALATARALSFNHSVKIIDSPDGQGKRIQPLYRWGVDVLTQSGISVILDKGATLVGPGTGITDSEKIIIQAPGSNATRSIQAVYADEKGLKDVKVTEDGIK